MIDVIAKIELAGNTLYIGNRCCYRSDGGNPFFVNGALQSPVSSYSLGDLRTAKYEEVPLTFRIDNNDGTYDAYLPGGSAGIKYWHGATVTLYVGGTEGGALTTGTQEYKGTIAIGGVIEAGGYLNVTVQPITLKYDVELAADTVNADDNPTAPEFGATIPLRIGDFTGAAFVNATALSCPIIADTGSAWTVKVNDGSIDNVTVYRLQSGSWQDRTADPGTSIDNANGTVTLDTTAATEDVRVACKCWPQTYSGPTTFKAVDVIEWMLTDLGGVPAGDIDSASFTAALAAGDGYEVRRDMVAPSTLYAELSQLALETGYSLYQTRGGKYGIQFFMPTAPAIAYAFNGEQSDSSVVSEQDPDRLYCNRVSLTYDYIDGAPRGALDYKDTTEIAAYGKEVTAVLPYVWIPSASGALLSVERKVFFWKNSPEVITFAAPFESESSPYDVFLLDTVTLSYRRYVDRSVYVRSVNVRYNQGIIEISGYNLASLPRIGLWAYGTHLSSAATAGDSTLNAYYGYNVLVGQLIQIGADDNGGAGYEITANTATTIDITPVLGTNQALDALIVPMEQIAGAGVWGTVSEPSYWF